MDGTLYAVCIYVKTEPTMHPPSPLDLHHRKQWHPGHEEWHPMGKRITPAAAKSGSSEADEGFGPRLASLRKAAGFTQVELAAELGISQRMVAYYESPSSTPPANLLPQIATALAVSIDELFGRTLPKKRLVKQEGDSRLRRRLLAIEKLDLTEKRQVLQVIDAFIERGQLKRKASAPPQRKAARKAEARA